MEPFTVMTPGPSAAAPRRLNMSSREVVCPLGHWTHSEARPPSLAGIVDFMWMFEGSMTALRERTLPNGQPEIIVHMGERYRDVVGDRVTICPPTCVTGVQLGPAIIEAPGHATTVLGIRLTIAGAYALFGRPMHEVTGLTVDLRDLTGTAAAELEHECCEAADNPARFHAAAAWIEGRLRSGIRADPAIAWTLEQIRQSGGSVSMSGLRERASLSRNRMAVAFREQAGVTPKQYARIIRFRRVLAALHAGTVSLADAAHDAGYYDQPHMTVEFKQLSGMTPGQFLHSLRYPNSLSIAE